MLADQADRSLDVVERRDQDFVADPLRDTRGVGRRLREVARPRRRHAHQRVVAHAMKSTLEFQDLVAAVMGARDTHGVKGRLRPAAEESHFLGARHRVDDFFGEQDAVLVVGEECRTVRDLRLHGFHHVRMAMPDQHRTRAQQIIDIFVAADVPDVPGFTFLDHHVERQIAKPAGWQNRACLFHQGRFRIAIRRHLLASPNRHYPRKTKMGRSLAEVDW